MLVPAAHGSPFVARRTEEVRVRRVVPAETTFRRLLNLCHKAINFVPQSRGAIHVPFDVHAQRHQLALEASDDTAQSVAFVPMSEDDLLYRAKVYDGDVVVWAETNSLLPDGIASCSLDGGFRQALPPPVPARSSRFSPPRARIRSSHGDPTVEAPAVQSMQRSSLPSSSSGADTASSSSFVVGSYQHSGSTPPPSTNQRAATSLTGHRVATPTLSRRLELDDPRRVSPTRSRPTSSLEAPSNNYPAAPAARGDRGAVAFGMRGGDYNDFDDDNPDSSRVAPAAAIYVSNSPRRRQFSPSREEATASSSQRPLAVYRPSSSPSVNYRDKEQQDDLRAARGATPAAAVVVGDGTAVLYPETEEERRLAAEIDAIRRTLHAQRNGSGGGNASSSSSSNYLVNSAPGTPRSSYAPSFVQPHHIISNGGGGPLSPTRNDDDFSSSDDRYGRGVPPRDVSDRRLSRQQQVAALRR